jgi:hypothetical protein
MRLPTALSPQHYTIELRPHFYSTDVNDFILEGNVTITLQVRRGKFCVVFPAIVYGL